MQFPVDVTMNYDVRPSSFTRNTDGSTYAFWLLWHLQVINISSPNTPGLRKLQARKQLKDLVKKVGIGIFAYSILSLIICLFVYLRVMVLFYAIRFKLLVMRCNGLRKAPHRCLWRLLRTCPNRILKTSQR